MLRLKPALWSTLDPARQLRWPSTIHPYILTAAIVAAVTGIDLLLTAIAPQAPGTFILYAGIVIVAWFLGAAPGWFSVILSTAAAHFILIAPDNPLTFTFSDIPWLFAFGVCAAAANAFSLRRRAAEREARNELVRASQIASAAELAATIAHELNQPLAAVIGNCEAAANWLGHSPPLLPQAQISVAAAVEAGDRAVNLLKRIRSLVERGRGELKDTNVNDVVESMMLLAGTDLARRDISPDCHYDPDLPPIIGDRVQLQQLMLNLINNAMEAMDHVGVGRRALHIRTSRNGPQYIRVVVEDTGKGFGEADVSRLFQPFYSTKEHGMGIGLSVCRTIVESHGGVIRAASGTKGGARFEVDLPAKTSA